MKIVDISKPCRTCGETDRQPCGNCRPCARRSRKIYEKSHRHIQNEKIKKHDARHRDRKNARLAVIKAVKRGQIKRSPFCLLCWKVCKTEGHHPDYSKRFEIVWLCGDCHRFIHGRQAKQVSIA
jgi:hypothetical protein